MTTLVNTAIFNAKKALNELVREEQGDVNVVSIVVLIGIALVLAILFKDQIMSILQTLLSDIDDKAQQAIS